MVTKAIIQEVLSPHKVKVRMPLFNKIENANGATPNRELPICPICTLPNFINDPRVGDIVFVAPEDYDVSRPVVLGYLSTEAAKQALMNISCNNFNASGEIKLGKDTQVGNITYTNIECLKDLTTNLKLELESIEKSFNAVNSSISDLQSTTGSNATKIGEIDTQVQTLSLSINSLSQRIADAETSITNIRDTYVKKYPTVLSEESYGDELPTSGENGQIFFLLK